MSKLAKFGRQIVSAILGIPLLIVGIILIPLPGPGVLISFIALLILSWGFDWAHQYIQMCKDFFQKLYREAKERADRFEEKHK